MPGFWRCSTPQTRTCPEVGGAVRSPFREAPTRCRGKHRLPRLYIRTPARRQIIPPRRVTDTRSGRDVVGQVRQRRSPGHPGCRQAGPRTDQRPLLSVPPLRALRPAWPIGVPGSSPGQTHLRVPGAAPGQTPSASAGFPPDARSARFHSGAGRDPWGSSPGTAQPTWHGLAARPAGGDARFTVWSAWRRAR